MSQAAQSLLTADEYLAVERAAETKSEYHDGQIFAMAGGTAPHAELAMNFGAELRARSKGGPCRIYSSDMRIAIPGERSFVYPDVSGLCVEPRFRDETRDVLAGREATVRFESLDCEIALAEFFDGVELAPLPPAPARS